MGPRRRFEFAVARIAEFALLFALFCADASIESRSVSAKSAKIVLLICLSSEVVRRTGEARVGLVSVGTPAIIYRLSSPFVSLFQT